MQKYFSLPMQMRCCRFQFSRRCAPPQRQLPLGPLQIPYFMCEGLWLRADSGAVTAASCHDWPEQRAIDHRSCRTRCQYAAVSGQSDGSTGTELIESQSYRPSREAEVGQSIPCLWHRSGAFFKVPLSQNMLKSD